MLRLKPPRLMKMPWAFAEDVPHARAPRVIAPSSAIVRSCGRMSSPHPLLRGPVVAARLGAEGARRLT
jgi:hypothetical protein